MSMGSFGQGSGSVLLDSLQCFGNETYLLECPGAIFQLMSPCQHSRDAGVMCNDKQCKERLQVYCIVSFYMHINIVQHILQMSWHLLLATQAFLLVGTSPQNSIHPLSIIGRIQDLYTILQQSLIIINIL